MAAIDTYLQVMLDEDASDLHLCSGVCPMYRIHGLMVATGDDEGDVSPPELV